MGVRWPGLPVEQLEALEQLRALWHDDVAGTIPARYLTEDCCGGLGCGEIVDTCATENCA